MLSIILKTLSIVAFTCPPGLAYFFEDKSYSTLVNEKDLSRSLSLSSQQGQFIDKEKEQLFKNGIKWITFRTNGKLSTDTELAPFLDLVRKKYLNSNFYKTIVIAFQQGILPKLTLNEGDTCNPQYIGSYRDPSNYSVTHYYQNKFIFDSVSKSNEFTAFCDYRQGLVCNPNSKKCACPLGGKMEVIDPVQKEKRCLLQKGEICALIDLSHSQKHDVLKQRLPHLIFNLEKPLGCKEGTQCRFKDQTFPKCYSNDEGPFKTYQGDESFDKTYGTACTLNLIAQPGMCELKPGDYERWRGLNGYVCYNYWGRDGYFNKTGFCANEYGPFSEIFDAEDQEEYTHHPFLGYFVNPKTTPLRGEKLEKYQQELIRVYVQYVQSKHVLAEEQNRYPCFVERTQTMLEIYRFFASLPTKRNVDENTLQEKLKLALETSGEGESGGKKICNVFWRFEWDIKSTEVKPMICEANTETEKRLGVNNGFCKASEQNQEGHAVNKVISENIDRLLKIEQEISQEETNYDMDILNMDSNVTAKSRSTKETKEQMNNSDGKSKVNGILLIISLTQFYSLSSCM